MKRASGILMHITSLPSKYGIGTLGADAYNFVDFLKNAGQTYWQILPIGNTIIGDSPYQSPSTFAGNINFIDFDLLRDDGFLNESDYKDIDWGNDNTKVNYYKIYLNRKKVLQKATEIFDKSDENYKAFCNENNWLDDFALFMAIKDYHSLVSFNNWDKKFINKDKQTLIRFAFDNKENIDFYRITQYLFFKQYKILKTYANKNGIKIIGDIPFYVAYDSADVWANPTIFELDENLKPKSVAGVPPDYFSPDGQLWGNPLYRFDIMEKDKFSWWRKRLEHCFKLFDVLRIDHFRAFDSYYAVPYGETTAKNGEWREGVGTKFFDTLNLKGKNIIVEDLGDINDSVRELVKYTGFPNMKILQFSLDSDLTNEFLPQNYSKNCVVYTGTHDNMTTKSWYKLLNLKQKALLTRVYPLGIVKKRTTALIEMALSSIADTAIIPMQDYLNLDDSARMNIPSTIGGNWAWRVTHKQLDSSLETFIYELNKKANRLP